MKGRTRLVKFEQMQPRPCRSRLGSNAWMAIGTGVVIEAGTVPEMQKRQYELGGPGNGYMLRIDHPKLAIGDTVAADPSDWGCR